jgi:uncharacterized SAM-binding protein YcdF (DUF218 family)
MFEKKYIFETRHTRSLRKLKNASLALVVILLGFLSLGLVIVRVAEVENERTQEFFFNRPPDVIVVFTGDFGRIPHALKLANHYKQPNVFITGVYSKNSVQSLLSPINTGPEIDPNLLEIDYQARNTVENVLFTLRYLRESKALHNVLIVSHDYHLLRIKLIVDKLMGPTDQFHFYYSPVKSSYSEMRSIRMLYKEAWKSLKALVFLMFWDAETELIAPTLPE